MISHRTSWLVLTAGSNILTSKSGKDEMVLCHISKEHKPDIGTPSFNTKVHDCTQHMMSETTVKCSWKILLSSCLKSRLPPVLYLQTPNQSLALCEWHGSQRSHVCMSERTGTVQYHSSIFKLNMAVPQKYVS
jgi:hypothetical protein